MTRSAVLLLGCFAHALGALMGSAPCAPSQQMFQAIGSLSAAARGPAPFRPSPVRPVRTLPERSQHVEMAYRDEDGDAVETGPEGMDWDDDWRSFMRRRGLMRSHISTKVDGNVLVVSLDWHFWLGAAGGIVRRPPNSRPCPRKPSSPQNMPRSLPRPVTLRRLPAQAVASAISNLLSIIILACLSS